MDGILVINKQSGFTSRDVVNLLNKKLHTKKIGHTGTLDPIATGVLVVCIGKYTKLVDKITCYDKEYVATIKLGIETDTLDITGNVLKEEKVRDFTKEEISNVLKSFLGCYEQEVPKYSAIKMNGKKLYEYARNGEDIDLPRRKVEISEIELLGYQEDTIKFRCVVSKGTYIRSLIRDICCKLHVLGTMASLERTRQGTFKIEDAYFLDNVNIDNCTLLKIDDIFSYPHYTLNQEEYFKVQNGGRLKINKDDTFLILDFEGNAIAIYENVGECFKTFFRV